MIFLKFGRFRVPILVPIAISHFSVSNGIGTMSVAAQELELWSSQNCLWTIYADAKAMYNLYDPYMITTRAPEVRLTL